MRWDRGDVAFAIYLLANVAWEWAAVVDLGGIYAIADAVCVLAAAVMLVGWRARSPLALAAGAALTLACQAPFYARGFARGGLGTAAQVVFVASFLALLLAAWAWRRSELGRARLALRVTGALLVLDGALFVLVEGAPMWDPWQIGNLLSGVAGIPLSIADVRRRSGISRGSL